MPKSSLIGSLFDISKVRVKFFVILLSIIYLSGLAYYVATRFGTDDPIPHIDIDMEQIKQARFFTVRVKTGLFIKNIPVFEEIKNIFRIDAIIWFEFNPSEIMLETVEKFSFDNGKILYRSPPNIKVKGDKIFVKYDIMFEVKTDLRFYRFPFDDHRLSIILSNDLVTPDEMVFVVERPSFQIANNIFVSNWEIYDFNVHFGYTFVMLDQVTKTQIVTPKALFMINFIKASMRGIFIVFLPIFAACFLALFSFLLALSDTRPRFALATSGLTALLGYRFVIERMMPVVGYFTTTDEVYLFLLLFIFSIFVFQLLFARWFSAAQDEVGSSKKNKDAIFLSYEKLNNAVFIGMVLLLLLAVSYILLK